MIGEHVVRRGPAVLFAAAMALAGLTLTVHGQAPEPRPYLLGVATTRGTMVMSLIADGGKLSDIAADLAVWLRIPVAVGPAIRDTSVSTRLVEIPLESALAALAPRVYIDYEIRQGANPTPRAVYLLGAGDPDPAPDAVIKGTPQAAPITGAQPAGSRAAENPVRVVLDRNRLTIVAAKQPLRRVLGAVSDALGVPAEAPYGASELVDADVQNLSPEEAIVRVAPNISVFVRAGVGRPERALLRIVATPRPPVAATRPFTLAVANTQGITGVSLSADGATLSQIAADLATRLRIPVAVGPTIRDNVVVTTFVDLPLEAALGTLAPRVFVDYEFRAGADSAPQGIFLLGASDPDPAADAVVKGVSMGVVIEGNTEDTGPTKDDPLKVAWEKNRLSVTARKQPLFLVLRAIADVMGVQVETKYDALEPVDIDLRSMSAEDLIPRIAPNISVYVRVGLDRPERPVLRVVAMPRPAR